jgi:predicted  nucleic acid-binding Zn-ribbon protein
MQWIFAGAFALLAGVLGLLLLRSSRRVHGLEARYSAIIDLDAELNSRRVAFDAGLEAERSQLQEAKRATEGQLETIKSQIRDLEDTLRRAEADAAQKREQLEAQYRAALGRYNNLKHEVSLLEENLEDISFGLYKPHFNYETSEEYKSALERVRDRQRSLIKEGKAAVCNVEWTVSGSKQEGARMQKQYLKLMLRAFNGECDAAVANVSWNNVVKMEERIRRSFDAVNDLGRVMQMSVTPEYLDARLTELRLAHEYQEKRYAEREEQRKIREQIREEEKAQREFEKAREDAEKEEARYQKALEKARQEANAATGAQLSKLTEQITSFEAKLDEARKVKAKAIARAQLTKSGFVYVISNIGSFGEKVFKIGMTRRMEPMDRIQELGDASVPFPFDLHVMLYSDNAPELEGALHELFGDRRVNLVNARKEFYRDVELAEIEEFVRKRGLSAQFVALPEAKEYRETLAIRVENEAKRKAVAAQGNEGFAPTLFPAASAAS